MSGTLGIVHLETLAHAGFLIAGIADDAATGKNPNIFADLYKLMSLLPDIRDVLAHYTDAVAELNDLNDAERTELYNYCISQLSFPQEKVEEDIQKALLTGCKLHEIFLIWKPATDVTPTPAPAPAPAPMASAEEATAPAAEAEEAPPLKPKS